MADGRALRIAINLVHLPSRVRKIRSDPLPEDVLLLLRIASGDKEAQHRAAALTGRTVDEIRQAATFFIEQVLLYPDADSYHVLGASPRATNDELRRNMSLLLKWLHPDLDRQSERSVYARRVTMAWNDLKTPVRRSAYDMTRRSTNQNDSDLRRKTVKTGYHSGLTAPKPLGRPPWRSRVRTAHCPGHVTRLLQALLFCFHRRRYR